MMQPPGSPKPFAGFGSPGGHGILFAKRKRNLFKGPMLNFGNRDTRSTASGSASHSRSASATGLGRRSGESAIQEVDEDAVEVDGEEDVEEVEAFCPVVKGPGEVIEEKIFEDGQPQDGGSKEKEAVPS
jgi:hypothetical protein